jgi:hypothetical protein
MLAIEYNLVLPSHEYWFGKMYQWLIIINQKKKTNVAQAYKYELQNVPLKIYEIIVARKTPLKYICLNLSKLSLNFIKFPIFINISISSKKN